MHLITYRVAELEALIACDHYATMSLVPISRLRAISHTHNPRARPEDVLLIVAYEAAVMIGYLGILADDLYDSEGQPHHCGWFSCLWVHPLEGGKGVAKKLIRQASESWNNRLLVTEFTAIAEGLYNRSGRFDHLAARQGLRCFVRFNSSEILPKKKPIFNHIKPLLKLADSLFNIPQNLRLKAFAPVTDRSITITAITSFDREMRAFIAAQSLSNPGRRGCEEYEWIRDYPWLMQSPPTSESARYYFSMVADRFENHYYQITHQGRVRGYLHISLRDNHVHIPYCYIDQELVSCVASFITRWLYAHRATMLTTYHPLLVAYYQQHRTPYIYLRPLTRKYIVTHTLLDEMGAIDTQLLQDGDADAAFT